MIKIGILIYPKAEELDFMGPYEVLSYINKTRPDSTQVMLAAETTETVRTFNGLRVVPDVSVGQCPPLDVVFIPGGQGRRTETKNPVLQRFIAEQAKMARYMVSVCTGAFFLAEAGLLRGKRATTYHTAFDELASYGVNVVKEKAVRDGSVITGAGVSSGIETSLVLLAELFGTEAAQEVACRIEYDVSVEALVIASQAK